MRLYILSGFRRLVLQHGADFLAGSSFRNYSDFFKFRFLNTKKSRHLNYLIDTYEVARLSAELLHTGSKFPAFHCLWYVQAEVAGTVLRAMQTEVANSHS